MRTSEQYNVAYKDIYGKEQLIGTFWMYEDGSVDEHCNLSKSEMAEMLKVSVTKDVYSYSTGNTVEEED